MTIECLKESGIGKEVKRVSKSSSSNSGESEVLRLIQHETRLSPFSLSPFSARIQWSLSEFQPRVELPELQSIVVSKRHNIMYLTATSPFQRTQRLGTWHQTSLLNGVLSSPLARCRRRRLPKRARVSHVSPFRGLPSLIRIKQTRT